MKYEIVVTAPKHQIAPDWKPGMDRLEHFSPYGRIRETHEMLIESGEFSRYVEHDDRLEQFDNHQICHTIFNTLNAAQMVYNMLVTAPEITVEIVERPDL